MTVHVAVVDERCGDAIKTSTSDGGGYLPVFPWGIRQINSSPRWHRPWLRAMLVLAQVSLMKISFPGSNSG
ncbi:hypothetical protein OAJ57_01380 [Alphaproteobacteria bacterium]|nr:hypothetical protein [Alphaproteobacteria bacterium]